MCSYSEFETIYFGDQVSLASPGPEEGRVKLRLPAAAQAASFLVPVPLRADDRVLHVLRADRSAGGHSPCKRWKRGQEAMTPPAHPTPAQVILNSPIEEWPKCDCLMSWHSDGVSERQGAAGGWWYAQTGSTLGYHTNDCRGTSTITAGTLGPPFWGLAGACASKASRQGAGAWGESG